MKILVTGGAGFIGSNFVRFQRDNYPENEISIIDDLSTGLEVNLEGIDCQFIRASILDAPALRAISKGHSAIVHLAAIGSVPRSIKDPRATHDANVTGTLNVLEVAREFEIGQVIVASSSSVYGSNPALPKSEDLRPMPISPYAVSKLATEAYAVAYAESYQMRVVPFRFFNVYGPNQRADHPYAAVIPRFLESALAGVPVTVHGDGLQSRDFTYVDSVSETISSALVREMSLTSPINLAFGLSVTLNQVLETVEALLGRRISREHFPAREGDIRASTADTKNFLSQFPGVRAFSIEDGLKATLRWKLDQQIGGLGTHP